jgi:hypothetical protein
MTEMCNRTTGAVRKALRAGLKSRLVTETNIYDWGGRIKPEVIAQLTKELILDQPGTSRNTVTEVEKYLRSHGLELRVTDEVKAVG